MDGSRGGWSESLSDRLVDGNGTSCIRSGGRVAGIRRCSANISMAKPRFVVLTRRSVTPPLFTGSPCLLKPASNTYQMSHPLM